MTIISDNKGIRFATLASMKGRLHLEVKGITFRGISTLRAYNETFGTKFARKSAALADAEDRVTLILRQQVPDECYGEDGNPLPEGRCDTCGTPVFSGKCALFPEHEVAVEG